MKKILIICAGAGLMFSSCKKDFLDVNNNPNSATFSRADYQMNGAIATSLNNGVWNNANNALGGAWSGYWGFSTSFTGGGQQKTYKFSNTDFNYWDPTYDNIYDYQYVIDNASGQGYAYLVGPAIVMQAMLFQRLVDMYNNVPYSQALKLRSYVTPTYDGGQNIYEDLIKKLDTAITLIKAATFSSAGDIMFNGSKTNWVKLANTLKLRILLRQSYMPGRDGYITGEINKIITEGSGFLTSDARVNPGYLKQTGKINPYYGGWGYNENDVEQQNHRFYKVSDVIVNFFKNTLDTFRLQRIADPKVASPFLDPITLQVDKNNFGNYIGVPLGARGNAYLETLCSSVGSALVSKGDAVRPMIFLSASESYFLQAEAAQRYGIAGLGSAQTLYESGVTNSFILDAATYSGSATATVAAATAKAQQYLASGQDGVTWSASTDKLATIITQKWASLFPANGFEAWTEWRRTGLPNLPLSVYPGANPVQPRRLYYPISESNTNADNVSQQGTINVYSNKIFWDKR